MRALFVPRPASPFSLLVAALLACVVPVAPSAERDLDLIIAVGASGAPEYAETFQKTADSWKTAAAKAGAKAELIGLTGAGAKNEDAAALQEKISAAAAKTTGSLWIVLIGHGTFDGREAKFNLRGDDVTPAQMAEWLKGSKREIVLLAGGSASGAFIKAVSAPGRVVVTATKSADEVFFSRFGAHLAKAAGGEPEADLDQDRQVSVLEAFLFASRKVTAFYEGEGRLATEHALLDDNGDGIGTRAEIFQGVTAAKTETGPKPDGDHARQLALVLSDEEARLTDAQRQERDELELQIRALAEKRATLKPDDYYRELEPLMLRLARLYQREH